MNYNIFENMHVQPVKNVDDAIGDQNYPPSGSYIDVQSFTSFAFLVHAGDDWGTPAFQVWQDTSETETGSIKVITGATVVGLATDDDKWFTIEVEVSRLDIGNSFRYVTLIASATSTEEAEIIFVAWQARHVPLTQPSGYRTHVIIAG